MSPRDGGVNRRALGPARWAALLIGAVSLGVGIAWLLAPADASLDRLREREREARAAEAERQRSLVDRFPELLEIRRDGRAVFEDAAVAALARGHAVELSFALRPVLRSPFGPALAERLLALADDAYAAGDLRTAGTLWVTVIMNWDRAGLSDAAALSLVERVNAADLDPEHRTNFYGVAHEPVGHIAMFGSNPDEAFELLERIVADAAVFLTSGETAEASPYPPEVNERALQAGINRVVLVGGARGRHEAVVSWAERGLDLLTGSEGRYVMHRAAAGSLTKLGRYEEARRAYDALIEEADAAGDEALGDYAAEAWRWRLVRQGTFVAEGRFIDYADAMWAEHDRAADRGDDAAALVALAWQASELSRGGAATAPARFDAAVAFVMGAGVVVSGPPGPERDRVLENARLPVHEAVLGLPSLPPDQRGIVARRLLPLLEPAGLEQHRRLIEPYLDD